MNNTFHIQELAKGKLSADGYNYFVALIKFYIKKYNWPKVVLDENINENKSWSDDDIISFSQQLLFFVLEKGKLNNCHKIPENYIEYYFKTVLVSYVSDKIKEHQNKLGLSFNDTTRVCKEILNDLYFNQTINGNVVWNKENEFAEPVFEKEVIVALVANLQKIPITEKTKQYKSLVKKGLRDIFELINRPIDENLIFRLVFQLFDQSSFASIEDEQENNEIRRDIVEQAVKKVVKQIDSKDIPIFLDYFFSESVNSLSLISEKYKMPKSTIHYKTNQFTKIITESLIPENEQEGVWFLENIHKSLDELK